MKRKVKFQEGGPVEGESPRNRQLRETMEKFGREGKRVGLAERARERQLAERQATADRAAAQRDIAQFNDRMNRAMPVTPEQARNLGATRSVNPRPNVPLVPPAAAAAARKVANVATRTVPGANVMRALSPTSLEEGARFNREGMAQARAEQMAGERAAMDQEMGDAPQRMPTPRPATAPAAPSPARRPAASAPSEISADRLNDLAMGAEPMNRREREAQMRIRNRREDLAEAGTAFRKGGMVKPKAAPKKMMKGGMVAKPKAATKSKAKPMPFKKGGVIKKGRK